MKLYYSPGTCALSDHIVLEWTGTPYEAQRVSKEERGSDEFKKINTAGAVPVLEKDGWLLTQNTAILNYLADSFPAAKLGGDGTAAGRAEVNRWLGFVNSDVHPAFKPLFGTTEYLEDPAMIEKTKVNAKTALRSLFARADAQLAGRDWLTGSRSIADPYFYVTLRWAKATGVDLSGLDNLPKFSARMEADPGVQKTLQAEGLS
jgi:glutathione S-transferase